MPFNLKFTLFSLLLILIFLLNVVTAKKPNVIFYMPDDLEFYFPEAPASTDVQYQLDESLMPNFYRIRDEGTTFLEANVAGPKCAPSRFNILTGRYCSKSIYARSGGSTTNPSNSSEDRFAVTVPNCKIAGTDEINNLQTVLSDEGYATIHRSVNL
jgi:arylsulfatase A-like enzyme